MTNPTLDIGAGIGRDTTSSPDGLQAWLAPALPAQSLTDAQEAAKWSRLRYRHFTASGTGVNIPVTAGLTSLAIVFERDEPNADFGVLLSPSWGTTVWVTDKATTGFTAHFGTAAPGGGGTLDWGSHRSEDTP